MSVTRSIRSDVLYQVLKRQGKAPFLLSEGRSLPEKATYDIRDIEYPDDCLVGFDMRLAVTDEQVLESWKEFFDRGTNWKDFAPGMTLEQCRKNPESIW